MNENIDAVHGSGPNDVWLVGAQGTTLRWNGSTLSVVASGTSSELRGVWAFAPNDAVAVGQDIILRWNGTQWNGSAMGSGKVWTDVFGTNTNDIWVLGHSQSEGRSIVLRWNGVLWKETELRAFMNAFGSISGDSTGPQIITGAFGSILRRRP
ncbi:MAG: hypothetical protein ACOZIN_05380 [Myxococcota bacterium]